MTPASTMGVAHLLRAYRVHATARLMSTCAHGLVRAPLTIVKRAGKGWARVLIGLPMHASLLVRAWPDALMGLAWHARGRACQSAGTSARDPDGAGGQTAAARVPGAGGLIAPPAEESSWVPRPGCPAVPIGPRPIGPTNYLGLSPCQAPTGAPGAPFQQAAAYFPGRGPFCARTGWTVPVLQDRPQEFGLS